MARIQENKSVQPTTITKFLGLNLSDTGDTQIELGESGNMTNFYITDDYKLRKAHGYKTFHDFETPVKGMFSTKIGNTQYLLVAAGGKLYKFLQSQLDDEENWDNITATEIGSITNTDASFFEFDNKIYILSGGYYKWDGTNFGEVEGYIPTVFINTPAGTQGGGVIYDEINMLTPKKKQTFNGDGTTKQFKIAQVPDSIISVKVNGVDAAYTASSDIITITQAPAQGYDNVEICWSKDDGDRDIIEGMRFGTVFGGDVDTRVFLYGNPNCQNRVYFSGTAFDGDIAVPSVEYFPATAQADIGPSNFAVTDLTRQYDRLIATTNKPEAY